MRMPGRLGSATRHLLALVAVFAFGLSAGTPTLMHGCAHGRVASDAGSAAHHHADVPQGEHSAPADECRCVGHSCCTVLAVAPAAVVQSNWSSGCSYVEPRLAPGAPRADVPQLLPFANGPPAPLLS